MGDLKPGMKGTGRTVFSGSRVEEFDVEILGVLENAGPRQSIILARLSGGPLAQTGVMQGMSGSPVYIAGKLLGAVALAFPYSKEPIAGIRPISEMVQARVVPNPAARFPVALNDPILFAALPPRRESAGQNGPVDLATPLSLNGFTARTAEVFGEQLRAAGFTLQQGITAGRQPAEGRPADPLEPGAMISVQLLNGDMSVGADGTVTHVDGNRIWAFGHRFLAVGATELPFARSSVLALMPNLNTSFKIASTGSFLGSITSDTSTTIAGELNRRPPMVPLTIQVAGAQTAQYRMEMVRDRFLSPMLLQMALYSTLDATERTLGSGSVSVTGTVTFDGVRDPVTIRNIHNGDFNVPLQASLATVLPIAYALQNSLDDLRLKSIDIKFETATEKKQLTVDGVWTAQREVRPGNDVRFSVHLLDQGGKEVTRDLSWHVPIGASPGPLYLTVGDGSTLNAAEGKYLAVGEGRPSAQIIQTLNELRGNTAGYVRIWRADPAYSAGGRDLPGTPASMAILLGKTQGATAIVGQATVGRTSTVAELRFPVGNASLTGSRTVQVDIKE